MIIYFKLDLIVIFRIFIISASLVSCSAKKEETVLLGKDTRIKQASEGEKQKTKSEKNKTYTHINNARTMKSPSGLYLLYLTGPKKNDLNYNSNIEYHIKVVEQLSNKVIYEGFQMAEEILWHDTITVKIIQASKELKNILYLDVVKGKILKNEIKEFREINNNR